jgi:hypothetical protein
VASGTVGADLAAAVLFGGTFLGIAMLSLATGAHLGTPRSVAILTTGYSVGQVAGPRVPAPDPAARRSTSVTADDLRQEHRHDHSRF